MATTEPRTGFRLPWSADRAPTRDGLEEASGTDPSEPLGSPDRSDASDRDTLDAGSTLDEGASGETETAAVVDPPIEWAPVPMGTADEASPSPSHITDPACQAGPARRPTKFLIDLTHAMQVAAEQARAATLEQFRVDGNAYVEQIQGRSVADAGALRTRADEDIARIKDWSKAEIARIREETESRIAGRRGQLDDQLARHRALVERNVARIEGQIASFEAQMATFFDELLAETDLTVLAARAQQMPEAPSFDEPDETGFTALLTEPPIGDPLPAAAAEPTPVVEPTQTDQASGTSTAQAGGGVAEAAEPPANDAAFDREGAIAASQAATETAAALEAEPATPADAAGEAVSGDAAHAHDANGDHAAASDVASHVAPDNARQDPDPRIGILGLTPDFAAAEIAAAEAAAAEMQEIPEMDEQDLTARLAGLVPSSASGTPAEVSSNVPLVATQVIVSGLVSVASIASFKRHLSRAAGVHHVGVSSGPDGDFLFTVQHEAGSALRDLIPTLPGFEARVTGGDGEVVTAIAHDPED